MISPEHAKVLKVFQEATSWGKGGEVVLRCGPDTGRVFFAGGKIAWATVSTIKKTFTQYLVEQTAVSDEEAKEAYEDCKRTGKNFGETIVEWGLIDEATLRQLLLQHMSSCLLEIFCWPDVESMFMPDEKPYKGSLTYDFMEILQTVLIMDTEGQLPFRGLSAAQVLDELERGEVTQPQPVSSRAFDELIDTDPAAPEIPSSMRPPTEPAITPLSGEFQVVKETETVDEHAPILLTDVKKKKGRGALIVFIVFLILAAGAVAAYFFRDRLFGTQEPKPPKPEPVAVAPVAPIEEPSQASEDAGAKPDDAVPMDADAGEVADAAVEEEPQPEIRPGIVAGAEGVGTGSIRVVSKPKKARVYMDGLNTGKLTPCTLKNVPAGRRHVILVEKKGRRPAFGVVDLDADQQALASFNLRKKGRRFKGRIPVQVETEPPGATVFVEGGRLKKKTPAVIRLRADRSSRLELAHKGHRKWVRTVWPVPGMEITILVKLPKQ